MAVHITQCWDRDDETRERLRNSGRLILVAGEDGSPVVLGPSEVIPKSVANVRLNVRVLNVIMQHMAESCLALPIIDMVMAAVEGVYRKNKLELISSKIYQESWGVRKLCQLVKSRLYKKTPPKDRMILYLYTLYIYIYCEYNYYLNPAITTARQDQLLLELLAVLMACSVEAAVVLGCSAFWAWVHGVRGCNERIVCVCAHACTPGHIEGIMHAFCCFTAIGQ